MPARDLFEFSSDVETLVGSSGLADDLLKDVLETKRRLIAKLISGQCKTMESYADAVGGIRQLDFVLGYSERKRLAIEKSLGTPIEEED